MKNRLFSFILILAYFGGRAQETANWSALFGTQKQYVSTVIAPEYTSAYLAQIHVVHIAHAKVWAEIKKEDPTVSLYEGWNMLEKFSPGGNLQEFFGQEAQTRHIISSVMAPIRNW